jgi:hypothetical protein
LKKIHYRILIGFLLTTVKNISWNFEKTLLFMKAVEKKNTILQPHKGTSFLSQHTKLIHQIRNTGNIKFHRHVEDKPVVPIISVCRTHEPNEGPRTVPCISSQ